MRKISFLPVVLFFSLLLINGYISYEITELIKSITFNDSLTGIFSLIIGSFVLYLLMIINFRVFLFLYPLKEGIIQEGTSQQFIYDVYVLFSLILFYPIMKSEILPVPVYRLFYQLLGAKLGSNTYPAGYLFDPILTKIGKNTILGDSSKIVPHVLESGVLAFYGIKIGDNVTIGLQSTLLAGVTVEDDAIVAAHSLVTKHTYIKSGEVWAGVPAKKITS